jgi:hypothetical protein
MLPAMGTRSTEKPHLRRVKYDKYRWVMKVLLATTLTKVMLLHDFYHIADHCWLLNFVKKTALNSSITVKYKNSFTRFLAAFSLILCN